jgi:hypothetical protein
VAGGQIRYFIVGNGPDGRHGPGGESGSGTQITQWVERNFTAQDVGGTEIYDLTGAG